MRRVFLITILTLLISPSFARVRIELEFNRPGGWQNDGRGFFLKCVNPFTGEIVGMDDELTEGEKNTFYVDKDKHPQIVCWVFSYMEGGHYRRGPLVFRKKIETRYYYENGYCGNNITLPSEADIGSCGDGNISSMEACDTNGDKGCSSPTPVCYNCNFCGCGKDSDCVQVTGTLPCGYGKCAPTERAVDMRAVCQDGICLYPYNCVYDPACDPSTEPVDEKKGDVCLDDEEKVIHGTISSGESQSVSLGNDSYEISVDIEEGEIEIDINGLLYGTNVSPETTGLLRIENDSLLFLISSNEDNVSYYLIPSGTVDEEWNVQFFDLFGGADLELIINLINSNLESVPPMVVSIFGNERINIYLDEGNMFMETQEGLVVEMGNGLLADPTMNLYTDMATIEEIQAGTLNLIDALMSGRITYEAVGFLKGVQLFFVRIFTSILSFFGVL